MEIKHLIVGPLLTNCYLIFSKGEAAVIDPGGGTKQILKEIEENKAKLKYIILTHGHWDHTLSVLKIKGKTEAKILIHEAEKEFVKPAPYRNKVSGAGFKVDEFLKDYNPPTTRGAHGEWEGGECGSSRVGVPPPTRAPGNEIKIGDIVLRVIHTPGHSKGSICFLGDGFIFTGDTIFKDGYGRTDLEGGSQEDLENSLKKLKKFLKPKMKVYPGHGETFEIKT